MTFSLNIRTAEDIASDTLEAARAAALARIPAILSVAATQITGAIPVAEQISWPVKAAAARAYLSSGATPEQVAELEAEADLTGETLADLAQAIVARADAYAATAARMAGLRRATTAAVTEATEEAGIDAAITAMTAAMKSL